MKVILLAGGFGTRLSEYTDVAPKPMIKIGEKPMLWHIMNLYARYNHTNFFVALGYKGEIIKEYFTKTKEKWNINLVDTGQKTMTGGRVKRLKKFIGKTLNLKNRISENLYIFDSPDVTWEDEQLATLDYHLKQTFDLKNRYFAIEKRITIIKENLELFKGIWDHRESSTLEWIIIILIVIEVIDMFVLKFF